MSQKKRTEIHDVYVVRKTRRNALKFLFWGGGSFLLSILVMPILNSLFRSSKDTVNLNGFHIVETKNGLAVYTKGGEEVAIIEK